MLAFEAETAEVVVEHGTVVVFAVVFEAVVVLVIVPLFVVAIATGFVPVIAGPDCSHEVEFSLGALGKTVERKFFWPVTLSVLRQTSGIVHMVILFYNTLLPIVASPEFVTFAPKDPTVDF